MTKRTLLFVAMISILLAFVYFFYHQIYALPVPEPPPPAEDEEEEKIFTPLRSRYAIDVEYDGRDNLKATLDLAYVNGTGEVLEELYFHLYPNIFRNAGSIPFPKADLPLALPRGYNFGGIEVLEARLGEQKLEISLLESGQMLKLTLAEPLAPDEAANLTMSFDVTVPYANFRFGYQEFGQGKITMSLGNWYPILAVYKEGKWNTQGAQAVGDWTYSDIADYDVRFTVPQGFTVAASGVLEEQKTLDAKEVFHYRGEKLRDFAAAVSNNYEVAQDSVSGIKVYSYFHPQDRRGGFMALSVAKRALDIYSKAFGNYPYPELRIAEANYYCGGMEFPSLILMDSARYHQTQLNNTSFERSLAHEVAHQWFYNVVGSDQVSEPWMDEAITEFATLYYFEQRYGAPGRDAYYENFVERNAPILQRSPRDILDPLTKFQSRWDYFPVVYIGGVMFYEELRDLLGERQFTDFLKSYYDTFKYSNVDTEQFISFLKERDYPELQENFFVKWFGK